MRLLLLLCDALEEQGLGGPVLLGIFTHHSVLSGDIVTSLSSRSLQMRKIPHRTDVRVTVLCGVLLPLIPFEKCAIELLRHHAKIYTN